MYSVKQNRSKVMVDWYVNQEVLAKVLNDYVEGEVNLNYVLYTLEHERKVRDEKENEEDKG